MMQWSKSDLPESSLAAWERLISEIPTVPFNSAGIDVSDLRLHSLPGADRLVQADFEACIRRYEQLLEVEHARRRKKGETQTGVFFTPQWIAEDLVRETLGKTLLAVTDRVRELSPFQADDKIREALKVIEQAKSLRIVDPACGTGVFLVAALNCLTRFYREIGQLLPEAAPAYPARYAMTFQLFGGELDPLSLMLAEARLKQAVTILDVDANAWTLQAAATNLVVGDTLLSGGRPPFEQYGEKNTPDLEDRVSFSNLSREKARRLQFSGKTPDDDAPVRTLTLTELSEGRGWDFILGNPPYLSEVRGQAGRFGSLRDSPYYRPKMDLCDAFLAWALDHLAPGGQLAYVLPEYILQRSASQPLRQRLWMEGAIRELQFFGQESVFENAPGHHTLLLTWLKGSSVDLGESENGFRLLLSGTATKKPVDATPGSIAEACWLNSDSGKIVAGAAWEIHLLAKLSGLPSLLKSTDIQQGIVLPQGRLRKADVVRLGTREVEQQGLKPGSGIFLLNADEIAALQLQESEHALLRPFYKPAGFAAYRGFQGRPPDEQLLYIDAEARAELGRMPQQYTRIIHHLERFRPVLTSDFAPYGLHRPRQPVWFAGASRVLCPRQVMRPACAVVSEPAYVGEGFYVIRPGGCERTNGENTVDDADYIVAILNSSLAWFWFYHHKRKGERLQIDKDVLVDFPAPPGITPGQRRQLAFWASSWRENGQGRAPEIQVSIDQMVCGLYGLRGSEQEALHRWVQVRE